MRRTASVVEDVTGEPAEIAANPPEPPYLEFRNLAKVYATNDGPVRALDQVSISQRKGEFLSILGPSGCGKSTLLMIAAGLLPASNGTVSVQGRRVVAPRTDVGIVFQNPVLLEWRTALGNIMLQAEARKLDRAAAELRARALLDSVGLTGFEQKYPDELSGGMRQRVSHLPRADPQSAAAPDGRAVRGARCADARPARARHPAHLERVADDGPVHHPQRAGGGVPVRPGHRDDAAPGQIDRIIDIDLPRPRTLAMRETPEFSRYSREILDLFLARGVLRES